MSKRYFYELTGGISILIRAMNIIRLNCNRFAWSRACGTGGMKITVRDNLTLFSCGHGDSYGDSYGIGIRETQISELEEFRLKEDSLVIIQGSSSTRNRRAYAPIRPELVRLSITLHCECPC